MQLLSFNHEIMCVTACFHQVRPRLIQKVPQGNVITKNLFDKHQEPFSRFDMIQ